MKSQILFDNAKVMSKGQVTIPKDIRDFLGISCGDRVTFIVENGTVKLVNSAVYAMNLLQKQMDGEAQRTGLTNEDDIINLVKEIRSESEE